MVNRKKTAILAGGGIAVVVATVIVLMLATSKDPINPFNGLMMPLVDQDTLDQLPVKNGSTADTSRVGEDIIPPTNSWISGMVLQEKPLAVYPMPLSFLAKDSGFEIGLPNVQSTATAITGGHVAGLAANIDGATKFSLTRFDKVSATLTYTSPSQTLGTLTLSEGSPYVFYRASSDSLLRITDVVPSRSPDTSSYLRYTKAGRDYAVVAQDKAKLSVDGSTATISVPKGSFVTAYALPGSGSDTLREFAANELKSVSVAAAKGADNTTETALTYKTANSKPTVFAPMPYSRLTNRDPELLTYDSIYGAMRAISGTSFTTSVETAVPSNQLDLSQLTDAHKQKLIKSLPDDVAKTKIAGMDSYFAGKQLARAATLLDIAEQLDQAQATKQLKVILNDEFTKRLGGDYFYYDSTLNGIAAQTKAFGSEDFNDHHFHYGYFIYAASILGKYDKSFLETSQKQINLLAADIASYEPSSNFPVQRNYDPYAGHSWAAGLSPFADGNNQESSSEAINAWNGVALWAQLTNNSELESSAKWMLSNEAATAKAAWRNVDTSAQYLKDYSSPITSLNFGGKRTYSTFFSDEPNAKLGILLIPMSPVMLRYASDGVSIDEAVSASIRDDNYNVALGDYNLMYLALSDPVKAAELLDKQQDAFIDDGNSRTYLTAWIFSLSDTSR